MKKLTTEYVKNFITEKFPNIKLQENFEYTGEKIIIICKKHGEQLISFDKLKSRSKCGCPACGYEIGKKNMLDVCHYTEDEIKDKIYSKYGKENVDLSKFLFNGVKDKVTIICKKHTKEFRVSVDELCKDSRKNLCPKCRYNAVSESLQRNIQQNDFINLSKNIFNDSFLYNNLPEIINIGQKIILTCKKHGDVITNVSTHLKGRGCKKCGTDRARLKMLGDIKTILEQCCVLFNNFYNYDKVVFDGVDKEVTITCPIHGDFQRTLYNHLHKKHKCPKCSKSVSIIENEWLNELKIPNDDNHRQVKIRINDKKTFKVDGINKEMNTVYEFLGDYYHGNPSIYKSDTLNKKCHKTHGELYFNTIKKLNTLYEMGYKVIYIWEYDFRKGSAPLVWEYHQLTETILQFNNADKSLPPA